nr:hypothetical protein [Tanacetum cinerariifolium]
MNQNFYNSNSSSFDQIQPLQYPVIHHPPQETSVEILQARENLMKSIQTFLKKFNRISFRETPKVLPLAWEKFYEIQHAQPEDIHELLRKLFKDLQIISKELAEYINSTNWNCPTFYDDDDDEYSIQYRESLENSSNAITPDLPTEEPDNSLSMGDEHLCTILKIESEEVIKYSVENLFPIPRETRSGSTTTHSDYEAFYFDDDHIEEKSSGSTTTHPDFSLPEYDSFTFDLSIDPFPLADRSVSHHEEFADELTHIISSPEYDCFYFEIESDQGELTSCYERYFERTSCSCA